MNYKMTAVERVIFAVLFFVIAAVCVFLFGNVKDSAPKTGDRFPADGVNAGVTDRETAERRINVNTAGYLDLMELPGIGEKKAKSIIEYRSEHGPFKSAEDIMNVPGIGEALYDGFKDLITVGD